MVVKILQINEKATHEAVIAAVVIPVVNSIMCSLEIGDSNAKVMKMKKLRDAQFFEGMLQANGI